MDQKDRKINHSDLRKRAEKELDALPHNSDALSTMLPEKTANLIHQLQVHQVELEMQNEELRCIQSELEIARDRYAHLYDFAPVGYLTISEKGIIEQANLTAACMLQWERADLAAKPFTRLVAKEDQDIFYRHRQQLLEADIPQICRLRLIKKDGTPFYVQLECMLVEEGESQNKIRVTLSDITQQKRLEARLRNSHKIEAVGTLAGGIAHDFNNILSIIVGNTELAMEDTPDDSPVSGYLQEIKTASLRAKGIIRQILAYTHKTEQAATVVETTPLVRESLKLVRALIPKGIELIEHLADDTASIFIDSAQINQIIINLSINAAQAMPDGGTLKIRLGTIDLDAGACTRFENIQPGRYVHLMVSDTGPGISEEHIDRIFDPYFTTKEIGRGTGMGLTIVHSIVTSNRGAIAVLSPPGRGASFEIVFPVTDAASVQDEVMDQVMPGGNERLLLVDDEKQIVKFQGQILERLGYQVEAFTDPLQALELFKAQHHQIDLVVTDMAMPAMDGDTLIREIIKIRKEMPTILCTGFSDKIDRTKAKEIGARAYLEKPLDRFKLTQTIRKVLDQAKSI
jgi:PAS domain S-box-containing protein